MRLAIASDIHYPYQDNRAEGLFLSILPDLNLDGLMILGDAVDFEPISRFVTHPHHKLDLKPQIQIARKHFATIRKTLPNQRIWYKAGNHELRLETYLYTRAPELVEMDALTVPELMRLKELDIEWVPWEKDFKVGKIHLTHGDEFRVGSTYPARNTYLKVATNMMVGHHHRKDEYTHRHYKSDLHSVYVNPCLCQLSAGRWAKFPQWHQGFSTITTTKSGFFHVEQTLFWRVRGKIMCMIGDKLYSK